MSTAPSLLSAARPLFVIGCPRSGTTFTANLLNSHPEVLVTSETAAFILVNDVIRKSAQGVRAGINYGKQYHKLLSAMLAYHYRPLLQAYYERIAVEQKRSYLSYWGEKHPHLHECLERLDTQFQDACYLYLVRDPRDSSCSIADMSQRDYASELDNWKIFSDAYETFVATLAPERVLTVRYEDLVQDYYATAQAIFAWLELPMAPQVLDFLHKQKGNDAHAAGVRKDFAAKSVGRWRQALTPEQAAATRALAGAFMDKYGYDD